MVPPSLPPACFSLFVASVLPSTVPWPLSICSSPRQPFPGHFCLCIPQARCFWEKSRPLRVCQSPSFASCLFLCLSAFCFLTVLLFTELCLALPVWCLPAWSTVYACCVLLSFSFKAPGSPRRVLSPFGHSSALGSLHLVCWLRCPGLLAPASPLPDVPLVRQDLPWCLLSAQAAGPQAWSLAPGEQRAVRCCRLERGRIPASRTVTPHHTLHHSVALQCIVVTALSCTMHGPGSLHCQESEAGELWAVGVSRGLLSNEGCSGISLEVWDGNPGRG